MTYYDRAEPVEDDDPRWLRTVPFAKAPAEGPDVVDDAVWLEQHPLLTFYDRVAEARAGYRPPLIVQVLDAVFVFVNGVFRLVDQMVNLMWRLP